MLSKKEISKVEIAETIGRNIEQLRKEAQLSRKTLAGLMDITYQQLYKYERGQNAISAENIVYLKFCLGAENYNEFFKDLF